MSEMTPTLKAEADPEYKTRLEADRVTAQWKVPIAAKPCEFADSPLFGGERQKGLFD